MKYKPVFLEAFKDMPIAIVSFFIASFLPRIGYKKAMLIGLALVTLACISMYFGNSFDSAKILFATVGVSFALIKVSVYSLIGTVTESQKEHNALMSSIEGVFMIGIALAYFLFPAFNNENDPNSWLNVYWLLATLSLLSFFFLFFTKFEETKVAAGANFKDDFLQMFKLIAKLLTIIFVISVFLFVMIEQGILSWLPTFNTKVLHLPENISIMMASILSHFISHWKINCRNYNQNHKLDLCAYFLCDCRYANRGFILPKVVGLEVKTIHSLTDIPLIGFAFPLIGLFIAPIYPLLNSIVLSSLPKNLQSSMTGLIVIFSALGGTLGSRITGWLFKNESPEKAFYFTLIPMSLLLVSFFILKKSLQKMKFKLHINQTITQLLLQEDTDGDNKITIDDKGPKSFVLQEENGKTIKIEGTYQLSNLLQELALAKKENTEFAEIDIDHHIIENPVNRISRKIKDLYWNGLTRTIDEVGVKKILEDDKIENAISYLYVPFADTFAFDYFKKLEASHPSLHVEQLPENISPEYVLSLNKKPGILALALQTKNDKTSGVPFVVPGGRFNEMYGWDSYFIAMGLLIDDQIDLAFGMAENFKYQIDHYGKILNANRSYYLTRTQPPLYTSLIIDIIEKSNPDIPWIKRHLKTAIKEYQTVWMEQGKRLTPNGLNRYKAEGIGLPFEVEEGHFDDILEQYAPKYNLSTRDFEKKYLEREILDADLDAYFTHDRSMRESGHDTTNRLVAICADLNTVAINSLLYKYETDIAYLIGTFFKMNFNTVKTSFILKNTGSTKRLSEKKKSMNCAGMKKMVCM